jgi:hypothetical protein
MPPDRFAGEDPDVAFARRLSRVVDRVITLAPLAGS